MDLKGGCDVANIYLKFKNLLTELQVCAFMFIFYDKKK